jgi:phosphoribosyl-ATP pyrophosphohydrolase
MSDTLQNLFNTIKDRQSNPKEGSYTNSLFVAGIDEIAKKVGEEGVEVVVSALNQSKDRLISELADLTYHALVLMVHMGLTPEDVAAELQKRHSPK